MNQNTIFGGRVCAVTDCPEPAIWTLSNRCQFHEALSNARELSPQAFDRLRDALAKTPPLTDEERRSRRAHSSLRSLQWHARDLRREKRRAQDAGATKGQIADAIRRGKTEGEPLRDLAEIANEAAAKGAIKGKRRPPA